MSRCRDGALVTSIRPQYYHWRRSYATSTVSSSTSSSTSTTSSTPPPPTISLMEYMEHQIQLGHLRADKAQGRAARRLSMLQDTLQRYDNSAITTAWEDRVLAMQQQQQQHHHHHHQQHQQHRRNHHDHHPNRTEPAINRQSQLSKMDTISETTTTTTTTASSIMAIPSNGMTTRGDRRPVVPVVPRGMYLYGPVGTGKSMLMDTFFKLTNVQKKQRYHFHAFMAMVHEQIHQLKKDDLNKQGRSFHVGPTYNPVRRVGILLSQQMALLCLDEFQVTDVADAFILSQLFDTLWTLGTVLVATSNRPPTDLYEGGLNRSYFLPFIDLLQRHCIVHDIQSHLDYRRARLDPTGNGDGTTNNVMFWVVDPTGEHSVQQTTKTIDDLVDKLREGRPSVSVQLSVSFQRSLTIPQADGDGVVARFNFGEICQKELGASDYRAVAQAFSVVVIENIPVLSTTSTKLNEARRFLTLIDELYEARVALACTAAAPPSQLLVPTESPDHRNMDAGSDEDVKDMLAMDQAIKHGHLVGALANVRELIFAFERATSRIYEMTSPVWWETVCDAKS